MQAAGEEKPCSVVVDYIACFLHLALIMQFCSTHLLSRFFLVVYFILLKAEKWITPHISKEI